MSGLDGFLTALIQLITGFSEDLLELVLGFLNALFSWLGA